MGVYIELPKEWAKYEITVTDFHGNELEAKVTDLDLVRCGECKWWDRKDKESPFGYCYAEKHCHFSNNWEICIYRTYKADHFCADGERRADEPNTERD